MGTSHYPRLRSVPCGPNTQKLTIARERGYQRLWDTQGGIKGRTGQKAFDEFAAWELCWMLCWRIQKTNPQNLTRGSQDLRLETERLETLKAFESRPLQSAEQAKDATKGPYS